MIDFRITTAKNLTLKDDHGIYYESLCIPMYRCNSFIVDLRHKFTVRNVNEIPVFVQSSELGNIT